MFHGLMNNPVFEVFMEVYFKSSIFWNVGPCYLLYVYRQTCS